MAAGSVAIGVWVSRIVFAILVVHALVEEKYLVAMIGVLLGLTGWLVVGRFNPNLVMPCLAILDIGLVFAVLGRDIRLN